MPISFFVSDCVRGKASNFSLLLFILAQVAHKKGEMTVWYLNVKSWLRACN